MHWLPRCTYNKTVCRNLEKKIDSPSVGRRTMPCALTIVALSVLQRNNKMLNVDLRRAVVQSATKIRLGFHLE